MRWDGHAFGSAWALLGMLWVGHGLTCIWAVRGSAKARLGWPRHGVCLGGYGLCMGLVGHGLFWEWSYLGLGWACHGIGIA
jgi:hypothetical protein